LGAWRFFLGLRTSWMSREILVFGLFAGLASATLAALWLPSVPVPVGWESLHPLIAKVEAWTPWLAALTAMTGLAGVFTSVMIYVDTRRPFWGFALTTPKFFGTALLLGSITSALIFAATGEMRSAAVALAVAAGTRVVLFLGDAAPRGGGAAGGANCRAPSALGAECEHLPLRYFPPGMRGGHCHPSAHGDYRHGGDGGHRVILHSH
jgi:DMSO reductase anchor subunit